MQFVVQTFFRRVALALTVVQGFFGLVDLDGLLGQLPDFVDPDKLLGFDFERFLSAGEHPLNRLHRYLGLPLLNGVRCLVAEPVVLLWGGRITSDVACKGRVFRALSLVLGHQLRDFLHSKLLGIFFFHNALEHQLGKLLGGVLLVSAGPKPRGDFFGVLFLEIEEGLALEIGHCDRLLRLRYCRGGLLDLS